MHSQNLKPEQLVSEYYTALYSGDIQAIKAITTKESFYMTLESFGLRVAMKDKSFKQALKKMEDDPYALVEVTHKLSRDLKSREKNPRIEIMSVHSNGTKRQTVHFTEDGKAKVMYFSLLEGAWKIDYYAGRKVA